MAFQSGIPSITATHSEAASRSDYQPSATHTNAPTHKGDVKHSAIVHIYNIAYFFYLTSYVNYEKNMVLEIYGKVSLGIASSAESM